MKIFHHVGAIALALALLAAESALGDVSAERDNVYDRYRQIDSLVIDDEIDAHWIGHTAAFWFMPENNIEAGPVLVDAQANVQRPMFDFTQLSAAFEDQFGYSATRSAFSFDEFSVRPDGTTARVMVHGQAHDLDLSTLNFTPMSAETALYEKRLKPQVIRSRFPETSAALREIPAPDRSGFLTLIEDNLAIRDPIDQQVHPLSDDGTADEYWSTEGAAWSADGVYVAARQTKIENVHKVPVVHWLGRDETVDWIEYAPAGGPIPEMRIAIFDVLAETRVEVKTGPEPGYIQMHGFRADSNELYWSHLSRDGKRLELRAASASSGETRTVLSEAFDTFYSESSLHEAYGPNFLPLKKSGRFLWLSEADGWRHIYLYDDSGKRIRQLTKGDFPVAQVVSIDETTGWVYFLARSDPGHVYDAHLHRVQLDGGRIEQLTSDRGDHQIDMSPSSEYFLDTHSTVNRPPQTDLRRADGTLVRTVLNADIRALTQVGWTPPEEFAVLAADGKTALNGVIYKPYDFDTAKQYPVIHYLYGGPQKSILPRTFLPKSHGTYLRLTNALVQLGFVAVVLDARGTPERSKAFQDVVYENLGRHEIEDYASALTQLASARPWMDMQRVGVFGISFGGYFSIRALLQQPELYKVGVAGGPAIEFRETMAMVAEPLLGSPQQFPQRYDYADNRFLVNELKGKLLMIQGTSDVNVPFAQPMKFIEALIRADKPYDLAVLPDQNHLFKLSDTKAPNFRHDYWSSTIRRYFVEHLQPGNARQGER